MPRPDWLGPVLLLAVVLAGFVVEGVRIAMTGFPGGSEYAFVGYGIAWLFNLTGLAEIYGYLWYAHAALTGAFWICLPFTGMRHMIMAPVSIALSESREAHAH